MKNSSLLRFIKKNAALETPDVWENIAKQEHPVLADTISAGEPTVSRVRRIPLPLKAATSFVVVGAVVFGCVFGVPSLFGRSKQDAAHSFEVLATAVETNPNDKAAETDEYATLDDISNENYTLLAQNVMVKLGPIIYSVHETDGSEIGVRAVNACTFKCMGDNIDTVTYSAQHGEFETDNGLSSTITVSGDTPADWALFGAQESDVYANELTKLSSDGETVSVDTVTDTVKFTDGSSKSSTITMYIDKDENYYGMVR